MKTPQSEYAALRSIGFISGIDFVYAGLLIGSGITAVIRYAVDPQWASHSTPLAIAVIILMLLWIITLLYRGMYFVVKLRAAVELMPEHAGKIAAQIHLAGIAQSMNSSGGIPRS